MARAVPANMETRNRGASNAAAGRVSQRSHVQGGGDGRQEARALNQEAPGRRGWCRGVVHIR
ncbi:hypothetical protein [Akkermansia muciniphila]|uniref:hypothetical protein n=2 Tax=Akkermansia muciniphila TaxID=239935 RepID=UPI001C020BCE|nr:hypothetical protein [Akkermansia muciniphila]MBT9593565.1 hypothetical protein [Akkermansia muciniphila]